MLALSSFRVPTWNGSPEIPTGCRVIGTCVLLCDRSCSALFSTKESMWWTYYCSSVCSERILPDRNLTHQLSSLKQKAPVLSLTWKTVLTVPHTVEQKNPMIRAEAPKSHYNCKTHQLFITFGEAVPVCPGGCWAFLWQKPLPGCPRRHWVLDFKPTQNRFNHLMRIKCAHVQFKDFKHV